MVVQEADVASALWAAVALPPISPLPPAETKANTRLDQYGRPARNSRPLPASLDPAAMARDMKVNDDQWGSEANGSAGRRERRRMTARPQGWSMSISGKSEPLGKVRAAFCLNEYMF